MAEAPFSIEEHTASDGYRWRYRRYAPPGQGRAEIVCVHGIQSHGGWYHVLGRTLATAGYETHFPDRRGSGANRADRGHTPSPHRLLDDLAERLEVLRALDPAIPIALAMVEARKP